MERFTDARELDWLIAREKPTPPLDADAQRELDEFAREMDEFVGGERREIEEANSIASFCGLDAEGWAATAWILHAMYETDALPGGLSYDDVEQIENAAGMRRTTDAQRTKEEQAFDDALTEVLAGSTLASVHWAEPPGEEWTRLRWAELWRRLGVDPAGLEGYPSFEWFPYRSWPVNMAAPGEGSLDRAQFARLLGHLEAVSDRGGGTPCIASYGACAIGEYDHDVLYRGALREAASLLDDDTLSGSPSNLWPEDRSWLVYTDWDLWATKVSGTGELIERLERDPELEVIHLPTDSERGQ